MQTRLSRAQRAVPVALGVVTLAGVTVLLLSDARPALLPAYAHGFLGAFPLAMIAFAYLLYQSAYRLSSAELLKAALLAIAFVFWAANQCWPDPHEAMIFNDIAIALFVVDVFLVIVGWPAASSSQSFGGESHSVEVEARSPSFVTNSPSLTKALDRTFIPRAATISSATMIQRAAVISPIVDTPPASPTPPANDLPSSADVLPTTDPPASADVPPATDLPSTAIVLHTTDLPSIAENPPEADAPPLKDIPPATDLPPATATPPEAVAVAPPIAVTPPTAAAVTPPEVDILSIEDIPAEDFTARADMLLMRFINQSSPPKGDKTN